MTPRPDGKLAAVDQAGKGYGARIAAWIQKDLLSQARPAPAVSRFDALEDTLLAAMAGVRKATTPRSRRRMGGPPLSRERAAR